MPNYYPIMLDIRGRVAVVIGGDRVAAQKAAALTACGASVSVIGEQFCDELLQQAAHRRVKLVRKLYAPGDLAGAFVVVAATNDPRMIEVIWRETQERGQLVNIVDVPERCTFIMPSVLRRDQLTIAVSTEGASPGLAKRIRQRLEDYFPPAYGPYMRLAGLARTHLRQHGVSYERRDDFFEDYFTSPILSCLSVDDIRQATTLTAVLLQRYGVTVAAEVLEADLLSGMEGVGDAV